MPTHRYRIRCVTEDAYVFAWASSAPTECPNDAGHTIDPVATAGVGDAKATPLFIHWEPVEAGVTKVVANGRLAIEVQNAVTGLAAAHFRWCDSLGSPEKLLFKIQFVLKEAGTGSNVRLAVKLKAQATGEDSSEAFAPEGFVVVPVTHTAIGEIFEGIVELDASGIEADDAMAVQIGRDGANLMGAGTNDDVSVPIQVVAVGTEME